MLDSDAMPKSRSLGRRLALTGLAVVATVVLLMGAAAASHTRASDPAWLRTVKLVSKDLVIDALTPVLAVAYPVEGLGPVTPLDGPGFWYEDLDHPYLAEIRGDARLAALFDGTPPDVDWAADAANFLRDRFPHGTPPFATRNRDVLDLLDRAEGGAGYLCGTASKMLIQLVQAAGGDARKVRLGGHVVVEIWSARHQKWVLIDPDVNVRYEDTSGKPLNAWDMLEIGRRGDRDAVVAIPGPSPNGLYDEGLLARQLEQFYADGFAIDYHAKWLSLKLPRWHPRRSPSVTSVYYAPPDSARPRDLELYDAVVEDPAKLYQPPEPRTRVAG